ncbi:carbon-nitrogen family hydrolase [Ammoniphilus sp. CFH 90114]|uniref:carbon-nitrogen family hydrolase n=1 Tax=Ammoniphilus sp. CFH 90114 TaxID=2493665 RepID=UPI00100FF8BF|nr:carbon-nitrogen family hydrolase [Ammoniphilus sp. CFH 90114]RXT13616.1 carbon-nitrogen family hydrolase [Ammoniphilus sp. CFH 90114]
MNRLTIALLQMDVRYGEPKANRNRVDKLFSQLTRDKKIDVVVLPELWDTGYDLQRLEEIADSEGQEAKELFSQLAKTYGVHIIGGSVAQKKEQGVYNSTFVFNRQGQLIHEYSKVHLFRLMQEEKFLLPGEHIRGFELEGQPALCQICYDIRFPEGIRTAAANGAKILFVSAQWPHPRLHHWRQLLISRAIENQMFVIACNRVGDDPNNIFCGHSMVIDPWGEIVVEGMQKEETIIGEIDLTMVDEIRRMIPIFEDRRLDLYIKTGD